MRAGVLRYGCLFPDKATKPRGQSLRLQWHPEVPYLLFCKLPIVLALGCNSAGVESGQKPPRPVERISQHRESRSQETIEHDLGTIIAMGQIMHHAFILPNTSPQTLRILSAKALTPCCSSIEELPRVVGPGCRIRVPILFKPGFRTGQKRVSFIVRTDDVERPTWTFSVLANLQSELEVLALDGSDRSLYVGQPGHQRIRVLCRRNGEEGRDSPESVVCPTEVRAEFLGPPRRTARADRWMESSRDLIVDLPPRTEPGWSSVELGLRWQDGTERPLRVAWQVLPHIAAVPSGVILEGTSAPFTKKVSLISHHPFRIIGGSGHLLKGEIKSVPEAKRVHEISLVLHTHGVEHRQVSDVTILTDLPEQPKVMISVVSLPNEVDNSYDH